MRRRDRAGEKVRSLIVLSEHLHSVDVTILPMDKPLGYLGGVYASKKCRKIRRTSTQIRGQGTGYRLHQPLVLQVELFASKNNVSSHRIVFANITLILCCNNFVSSKRIQLSISESYLHFFFFNLIPEEVKHL